MEVWHTVWSLWHIDHYTGSYILQHKEEGMFWNSFVSCNFFTCYLKYCCSYHNVSLCIPVWFSFRLTGWQKRWEKPISQLAQCMEICHRRNEMPSWKNFAQGRGYYDINLLSCVGTQYFYMEFGIMVNVYWMYTCLHKLCGSNSEIRS